MKQFTILLISSLSALSLANGFAGGLDTSKKTPSSLSRFMIRFRGLAVIPDESSSTISVIGGNVTDISTQIVPELDISYFFTKNISTELVLATAKHKVAATGTVLGRVPLGSVWLLPPTLVLQYHFLPTKRIDPYIGVGVNYTNFYSVNSGPVASHISYQNSWGPAIDIGTDIRLKNNWFLNVNAKKVWIDSRVSVSAPGLPGINTKVKINPYLVSIGIGYRFA